LGNAEEKGEKQAEPHKVLKLMKSGLNLLQLSVTAQDKLLENVFETGGILAKFSGRTRPVLAFIIIPSVAIIISELVSLLFGNNFLSFLILGFAFLFSVFLYLPYLGPISRSFLGGFFAVELLLLLVFKSDSSAWDKYITTYFKKRGDENAIIEIEYIKKIIYIAIPILIILVSIYSINSMDLSKYNTLKPMIDYMNKYFKPLMKDNFFVRATAISSAYVTFLLFFMFEFFITKEFRFYFAHACIRLMVKQGDQIKKMHYLILGLNSYNRYLRRNLNLQFNDAKVYAGILGGNKEKITNDIADSFRSDKLKPLNILYETLADKNDFFVKQKIGQKVKDWGTLLAALIPVTITLLHFLLPHYFPDPGK
jgi:hypothetical protein